MLTVELECRRCGSAFVALRQGRRPRYCPRHRQGHNLGWQQARACWVCGASFWPPKVNASRCPAHRGMTLPWADRRPVRPRVRGIATCAGCGREFEVRTYGQRSCSRSCAARSTMRNQEASQ